MARHDDDDDDDDRPRKKKKKKQGGGGNMTIILIVLGIFGATAFGCIVVLIALLLPAVQQAREAARRTQSKNNLKQIGLGAHNFNDVMGQFPPGAISDKRGNQSWMTDLLPYMDQAPLYSAIQMQAPWDDPSNRTAMTAVIPTYLNPSLEQRLDPATGYGLSHYAGNILVMGGEKGGLPIREITDGTSNTILAGSVVAGPKPWGDPSNLRDPSNGIGPGPNQFLHRPRPADGANILMADGSVRFISANTSPQVMKLLADPKDGQQVPAF